MRSAEPISLTSTTPSLPQLPNGVRYPQVDGMRQRYFIGTHSKPRKLLENAQTPTTIAPTFFVRDQVHAVLGSFYLFFIL
jgi:hypothetical protein